MDQRRFHLRVIRVFQDAAAPAPAQPAALPAPTPDRLALAQALGAETAAQVWRTVFDAVMQAEGGGVSWRYGRYLLAFAASRNAPGGKADTPIALALAEDVITATPAELPGRISGPDQAPMTAEQLAAIAQACMQRLACLASLRAAQNQTKARP
jgi:hypothetical protein